MKNTKFSATKLPYLRNGQDRTKVTINDSVGSRICTFDWYQNHWPWM